MSDVEKNSGTHKPEFAGEWVKLGDLLTEYKELNVGNRYRPVAVGRFGIRAREDIYTKELAKDYSKNKVIHQNTLTVGMGSKQIDIGILTSEDRYSVSPAYHTYRIGEVDCDYLRYCLEARNAEMFKRFAKRGTRQGKTIDLKRWLGYRICLPSKERQATVVQRLAAVERQIDDCKSMRQRLDDLVKSQFVEMFGDPKSNPHGWDIGTIETIAANLDAKRVPITQSDREEGPYPYYGATGAVDSVSGYIFDERLLLVSEDGANLLARTYPIAFSIFGKTWVNNHAHVLKVQNEETQVFLEKLINMMDISEFITGSTQPKLTQKQLNQIPVMLPPMSLQRQFAEFVARVDKLGFDCCREIVCCGVLFSSMSASLLCT